MFRWWLYFAGICGTSGAPGSSAIKEECPLSLEVRDVRTVDVRDTGSEGTDLSSIDLSAVVPLGEMADPGTTSVASEASFVLSFN